MLSRSVPRSCWSRLGTWTPVPSKKSLRSDSRMRKGMLASEKNGLGKGTRFELKGENYKPQCERRTPAKRSGRRQEEDVGAPREWDLRRVRDLSPS